MTVASRPNVWVVVQHCLAVSGGDHAIEGREDDIPAFWTDPHPSIRHKNSDPTKGVLLRADLLSYYDDYDRFAAKEPADRVYVEALPGESFVGLDRVLCVNFGDDDWTHCTKFWSPKNGTLRSDAGWPRGEYGWVVSDPRLEWNGTPTLLEEVAVNELLTPGKVAWWQFDMGSPIFVGLRCLSYSLTKRAPDWVK